MRTVLTRLTFLALLAALGVGQPAHSAVPPRRPGPPLLYAPAASAAQLDNRAPWRAKPLLVSGASAYRRGEFLYQDYLFEDLGAGSAYTYPTGIGYDGNAADIVEVRLRLLRDALAVRITYDAMEDPQLVAATLALGTSSSSYPMPFGANTRAPGQVFVTAWGTGGAATDAATGRVLAASLTVHTDLRRAQVDVRVPFRVFDPRGGTVRVALAAGLWDAGNRRYLVPQASGGQSAPGGGVGSAPSAFFNVAFRYHEPFFTATKDRLGWHDSAQAQALSNGDLSPFSAQVDFRKLARGTTDEMRGQWEGTPVSGDLALIHTSRFVYGQGRVAQPGYCHEPCTEQVPEYPGALQPYAAHVPVGPPPRGGWGLALWLHACGNNYTPVSPDIAPPMSAASPGWVVLSPEGRGVCQWYWNSAGADVFEGWHDVAQRWRLDPARSVVSGVSMGGYGTWKLSTTYPDLFARAAPIIGCTSADTSWAGPPASPTSGASATIQPLVASLRNVQVRAYGEATDPVCTTSSQRQVKDTLDALAYRYTWLTPLGAHTAVGVDFRVLARFLGAGRVDPDPPHVTYVLNAAMVQPAFGLGADGAYWVSGIRLARLFDGARGTVDVRSEGFGLADPASAATLPVPGVEGEYVPVPHLEEARTWSAPRRVRRADVLHVTTTNVARLVIDPLRARVTCGAHVLVTSDTPVTVVLSGCDRTVHHRA